MDYETLTAKLLKGSKKTLYYVAVVPVDPTGRVLLGERKEDGVWTTPGGGAELNESPEQAAVRECFEEAGLLVDKDRLELIGVKSTPSGKPIHCYLYRTDQVAGITTRLDPDKEVQAWNWYSAQDLPPKLSRQKNLNRLETITQAMAMYHGLNKSNYGPKGGKQYSESDNTERKNRNRGEQLGEDKNRNVKPYSTSGSLNQQAHEKKMLREQKKKAKQSTKVYTKEEIEALNEKLRARGGEGSKGGHVVGHTPSGKPIYESSKKSMDDSSVLSLIEKLNKGGPGSGVQGHQTARKPSPLHSPVKAPPAAPMNKLQTHLHALNHGGVIPGIQTQSGKPVVTSMEAAHAHQYDEQDHIDAMNAHHELAHKTQAAIDKLKMAGHKVPSEGAKIAQFHEKKMKEHMRAHQYLKQRSEHTAEAIKEQKKKAVDSVKKATTQMGAGVGDRDLDTGSYAQSHSKAHKEWLERLYNGMRDQNFGDNPVKFGTDKGDLHLSKVDDGLYSGYFTNVSDVDGGEMLDNARVRIERITLPELVQLMTAKEWISPVFDGEKEPEDMKPEIAKDGFNEMGMPAMFSMNGPESAAEAPQNQTGMMSGPSEAPVDRKIKILELISKLLG